MREECQAGRLPEDFAQRVLGAAKLERARLLARRRRFQGLGLAGVLAIAVILPAITGSDDREPRARLPADQEELAFLAGPGDGAADSLLYLMPEAVPNDGDDAE